MCICRIQKTEFCFLIGKSGSGKSSLLQTIYGAIPFFGEVGQIVDYDLKKLTFSDLPAFRRKIGYGFFKILNSLIIGQLKET